jgi:8-oxo-dGTP pyrophosphatase MutT (NUDIX family)
MDKICMFDPPDFNPEGRRVASCIIEYNSRIVMVRRKPNKPSGNVWGFPTGSVNAGESELAAAVRETREETGLSIDPSSFKFIRKYKVRLNSIDFDYFLYHVILHDKPRLILNTDEHLDIGLFTPEEILRQPFVPGIDNILKEFCHLPG